MVKGCVVFVLVPCEETSMEVPNLKVFRFDELKRATGNFKDTAALGEGSFGRVYNGTLIVDETSPYTVDSKIRQYAVHLDVEYCKRC